jgi:THO complex subunit 4
MVCSLTTSLLRYGHYFTIRSQGTSRRLTITQVEVIVANADLIPQPKTLGQRISQPKAQPKSAATVKHGAATAKGAAAAGKGAKKPLRKGRNSRPAKKTAEELDSDMVDYFDSAKTDTAAAGAPAAANGGDAPMEDEIL